jgi:hypothetical protein
MPDRLDCRPDVEGVVIITRRPAGEAAGSPQVVARVYDPAYACMMAHSPGLLGALKWVRTLLSKDACHCQPGVRECVVCVTDDRLAEIHQGTVS